MSTRCVLLLALLILGSTNAQLTESEQQLIVQYHNDARGRVSPAAANMVALEWDDDLAQKAQGWADQCGSGHNPDDYDDDGNYIGENIASGSRGFPLRAMLYYWEAENTIYDYGSLTCTPEPGNPLLKSCGHYTQMVWAQSKYVGCGLNTGCPGTYSKKLVCNYRNGGNYPGVKPYVTGGACTQCPGGYSECTEKLCVRG